MAKKSIFVNRFQTGESLAHGYSIRRATVTGIQEGSSMYPGGGWKQASHAAGTGRSGGLGRNAAAVLRRSSVWLAVILGVSAGVGCVGWIQAVEASSVTLTVFVGFGTGNSPEQIGPQDEVARAFEARHPGVKVDIQHVDWAVHNAKFAAALAGGKPYDMALPIGLRGFHEFSLDNVWMPIDELLQRDKVDLSEYSQDLINLTKWQGKSYGIPFDYYTDALFYNVDLFDQAGLAPPPSRWDTPEWTWQALLEKARKLTRDIDGDGRIDQWGLETVGNMEAFEMSFGARQLSPDNRKVLLTTPEMLAAYRFWQRLFWEEHVTWNITDDVSAITQSWPFFMSGKIGMSVLTSYNLKDMQLVGDRFRWNVAAKPRGPAGVKPLIYVDSFAIVAASPNRDLAWEFAKFILQPEISTKLSLAYGGIPATRSGVTTFLAMAGRELPKVDLKVFLEATRYGVNVEPWEPPYLVTLRDNFRGKIQRREVSPEAGLEEAQAKMQNAVDRFWRTYEAKKQKK